MATCDYGKETGKMSNLKFLVPIVLFISYQSVAQPLWWMGQKKPYKWMFGLGWNAVDDDGRDFCQPFDANQSWNIQPYPTRINIDHYIKKGRSWEVTGCYNQYKSGKLINDSTNLSGLFISVDLNAKFSFYNSLLPMKWLDPYVSLGIGGTHRDAYETPFITTVNASLGANLWISRGLGIQLQTSGKFGITSGFYTTHADYLQHSVGIVYKVQPQTKRNYNNKPRYGWISKKQRYRGGRGNK